jgi:iron complex transport system substrate-binding protein
VGTRLKQDDHPVQNAAGFFNPCGNRVNRFSMIRKTMKKITQFLIIITILAMLLAGCAPAANASKAVTLTDGLGRTVTLDQPAKRIVSLAPSATEILFAVGAGDQVIGRDSFSNYPESVKNLQDVGGSMGDYSMEKITSLNPDLVVATEINTPEQVKSLEDLGLKVYYIKNPVQLDGLYPILTTVGKLTGHDKEAADLVKSLTARVDKVVKTIAKAKDKPLVFYELDGSDPAKPWTSGPNTFMDQLVQMAGGINVGASMKDAWAQISLEELLVKDPNIILLGDAAYGMTAEQVASRAGWKSLSAVKNNVIFAFNDDMASRPGPRMVDGLEALAKLIHPELYK